MDCIPQRKDEFYLFCNDFRNAAKGNLCGRPIVDNFAEMVKRNGIRIEWAEDFLSAMESDLHKKSYMNMQETISYMYGSAEVIGLMMAKILKLTEESFEYARLLGRSMQYINFIRDIAEDLQFERIYLPMDELRKHGLNTLQFDEISSKYAHFKKFVEDQLGYYRQWMKSAREGFKYIPHRYRVPVAAASDMYDWTAKRIEKHPDIVYKKKIKPSRTRIIISILKNYLTNTY